MKWITERDTKTQLVHFRIYFNVGSSDDPVEQAGIANLMARSLLWGTKKKGQLEFNQEIERLGASLSVGAGYDRTVFSVTVLQENWLKFLALFREMLLEPAFSEDAIQRLKTLIQGEIQSQLQDPRYLVSRALTKKALGGTHYEAPPEGRVETLARISAAQVSEHYRKSIVSNECFVAMVAQQSYLDQTSALEQVLSSLPSGKANERSGPAFGVRGRKAVIVHKKEMSTTPVFFCVPGFADNDKDRLELEIGNFIFGGDFTSRLIRELRAKNGWTYGASSGFGSLMGRQASTSFYSIYTFPSSEFAHLAIPKALELFSDYRSKGLDAEEFEFAQSALTEGYALQVDSSGKRLAWKIREHVHGRPYLSFDQHKQAMKKITLESVNQVVAKRFSLNDSVVAVAGDETILKPLFEKEKFDSVEVLENV